jgi:hypothetical protein
VDRISITTAELLAELERVRPSAADPDAALTREEIEDQTQLPTWKVRDGLKRLVKSGEWEHTKVLRTTISGITRPTDAYRPKKSA